MRSQPNRLTLPLLPNDGRAWCRFVLVYRIRPGALPGPSVVAVWVVAAAVLAGTFMLSYTPGPGKFPPRPTKYMA